MNSDKYQTLMQLFENSEPKIKHNLRAGEDLGALAILNRNIERLEGERYLGTGVSIGYVTKEVAAREPVTWGEEAVGRSLGLTTSDPLVGLTNNPRFARGGSGGGQRAAVSLAVALVKLGYALEDVVVIGSGGRRSHFDYAVFDDCSHFDNELSAHPGERHRQLSRKLTSRRSRAGKAGRWA